MLRVKRTSASRERVKATPSRVAAAGEREAKRYAGAFTRVRLVRAWIAALAAIAAVLSGYVTLLERIERWWASVRGWRAPRRAAVLATSLLLLVTPRGADATPVRGNGGPPRRMPSVSLTHDAGGTASVNGNASSATTFTLTNISTGTLTVNLVATACTGSLAPGSCSPSPASVNLASGAWTTITVSFSGGASAGSGTLTLAAKNTSGSTLASSSVTVTVNAAPTGPTVSTSPHRGDVRDVSQCIADCFESTLSFTTPAYISLDVPRSVTLLYRSGRAKPMGRLALDVSDATSGVTSFRLQLTDPNGSYQMFSNGTTSLYFARNTGAGQATRIVAEFDATSILTSAKLYTAYVTSYSGGTAGVTGSVGVRILIINDKDSPYGAGVDLVGVQRLSSNQTDGVVVTDGAGSASFFSGSCTPSVSCSFTSPGGDFSTLATGGGTYTRTYPDGTTITFNANGYHTATADRFGTTTQIAYGTTTTNQTVPGSITDPTGQSITFWYRDPGSLYGAWKEGTLGNIHTPMGDAPIAVDTANNARQWVELGGGTYRWRMSYVGQHLLDTAYDKASSAWTHSYRYGATLAYTDAPSVKTASGVVARPRTTLRNAADTLLERAAAGSGTTSASALAVATDLRAKVTDAAGNVTLYSLSRFGSPTKTKTPLVPADSNEYDPSTGQLLRSISPTGHEVLHTYDSSHRLKTVNDVTLGIADTIMYASQYSLPQVIYGSSGATWFTYYTTKAGWPLKTTSPVNGSSLTTHYPDSFGRDSIVDDPLGHRTTFSYETTGLRNRASVRMPNGQLTTFAYDGGGRVTGVTNPYGYGVTQRIEHDVLNRPTLTASSAYADTTRLYYSTLGSDSATVDPNGQAYLSYRNALGWVTNRIAPGSGADSVFYDIAGRPVRTRSRFGREVTFVYDSLNRLVTRTGLATQSVDSMWYDPNGKWVAAQSRVGANVISTDTIFTDEPNHMRKVMTNRSTIGAWRVESTFNPDDPGRSSVNLYKRVNNSDSTVTFTSYLYTDAQKRLTYMWSKSDTASFFYNGESLVDSISLRAGLTEIFSHTPRHELSTRGYTGASWVDDVLRRWYHTDSLARITERGGPDSLFQAFGYDSIGRLRSWQKKAERTGVQCVNDTTAYGYTCTGASPWILGAAITPTYDKVGNPADLGAATTAGNRLTNFNGVTMTYDADGNMQTRVTATTTDTLTWDEFGRLVSFKRVPQGQAAVVTSFTYDGFGRRARKTTGSNTLEYLWDGDQIIAEVKGTGSSAIVRTYTYYPGEDHPRSIMAQGETYFTSAEPDGSVNGLIRKSDRTVVAQYKYTPWGELESASQPLDTVSSLRWKGLPYDAETGLYYMRARYYDPVVRRFVSEDPAGLGGGLNLYMFAGADPVTGRDPSGLKPTHERGVCSVYSSCGTGELEDWMMSMHGFDDDTDLMCNVRGDPDRAEACLQLAMLLLELGGPGGSKPNPVAWVFKAPWLKGCPAPTANGDAWIQPLAWKLPTVVTFEAERKTEIMIGRRAGNFEGPKAYTFAAYRGTAYSSWYPDGKKFQGLVFCQIATASFTEVLP
jgi:RHS repeat-associated protein